MDGNEYRLEISVGCGPESEPSDKVLAKDLWGMFALNKLEFHMDLNCKIT